jgi:hypothetical protein
LARFGLHNLWHSLSHRLVNQAKAEPKVVQTIVMHALKRRWISTPRATAMKHGRRKAHS